MAEKDNSTNLIFVLGLVAFAMAFANLIGSIILAIVALVIKKRTKNKSSLARKGKILAIVALILSIASLVVAIYLTLTATNLSTLIPVA